MAEASDLTLRVLAGKDTVGAAWYFRADRFITCAHVVNVALGRPENRRDAPAASDYVRVKGKSFEVDCRVDASTWRRLEKHDGGGFAGDVAHLIPISDDAGRPIQPPPPHATLMPSPGRSFTARGFGVPFLAQGYGSGGKIGERVEQRRELRSNDNSELAPIQGFSGAPVLVGEDVVGIVASVLLSSPLKPTIDERPEQRALREERDEWRKQAGNTRVSYMIEAQDALRGITHEDPLPAQTPDYPYLRQYQKALRERDKRDATDFDLRVRLVADPASIPHLHRQQPPENYEDDLDLTPAQFLRRALDETTPIVISAPGGSGKTHFLVDVAKCAAAQGFLPFLIDIRNLKSGKEPPTAEEIIQASIGGVGYRAYQDAVAKALGKVVLIVDGLNERSNSRHAIAGVLFSLERGALIVGDRFARSGFSDCRWATVSPLSGAQIKAALSAPAPSNMSTLLASPFFLRLAADLYKGGPPPANFTRNTLFSRYFANHVFSDSGNVEAISKPAYDFYRTARTPRAPYQKWIDAGFDKDLLRALTDAGALSVLDENGFTLEPGELEKGDLEFTHQLLHDWCAASYVSGFDIKDWTNEVFDILTLWHASADAFDLAAEQLQNGRVTGFLTRAYDWDWAFVLEGILNLELRAHGGESPVDAAFRDAVFALNALRLFDMFEHTRRITERFVQQYSGLNGALQFFGLKHADIVAAYEARYRGQDPGALRGWRNEFLKRGAPEPADLGGFSDDPLTSWAAANIARINGPDWAFCQAAMAGYKLLSDVKAVAGDAQLSIGARWRIVHALGAGPPRGEIPEFLLKVVFDGAEDDNVRFGAARSVLEFAARAGESMRAQIFSRVAKGMSTIVSARVRSEFRRAAVLAEVAPSGWYEGVRVMLNAGAEAARRHHDNDIGSWEDQLRAVGEKISAMGSEEA